MPQYRFAGPTAYDFPASRDAKGIPLGTVEPGGVRDLDEVPGPYWVPADGDVGPSSPSAAEPPASTPSTPGTPAPPAVPPASPATQTSEAGGESGRETPNE